MRKISLFNILVFVAIIFIFACSEEESPKIENQVEINIALSNINGSSADFICNVTNKESYTINQHGLCWNNSGDPLISDYKSELGVLNDTSFNKTIENLDPETEYYVKAYVIVKEVVIYSEQAKITTTNGLSEIITKLTDTSPTTAISGGIIIDNGGFDISAYGVCWSTNQDPVITDFHTTDGTGIGSFTSNITGLTEGTTYYVRAYATNASGTAYGNEKSFVAQDAIIDYDGNIYGIITIGNQIWIDENLKTTHYADGSEIQLVESTITWDDLEYTEKAMCYYNNSNANKETYGALYTWAAAMNGASSSNLNPSEVQGVCPDGWHLPSDEEWKELEMYLGMTQTDADATDWRGAVGGQLAGNASLWTTDGNLINDDAFGSSGFNALPAGSRRANSYYYGSFTSLGSFADFWSATDNNSSAWIRGIFYGNSKVYRGDYDKKHGFSVRCIKNE